MGHEGICLQYFTIVVKTFSIIFPALLIVSIVLNLNSNTVVSSPSSLCLLKTFYQKSHKVGIKSVMHRKKIEFYSIDASKAPFIRDRIQMDPHPKCNG